MRARLLQLVLCSALAVAATASCGDEPERERKRALLQPREPKGKVLEVREKRRLFDDQGELLPSGEKVAGIMLPKGLTLYRRFEQQSFYRSDRLPFEKLEQFFARQLMSTTVTRTESAVTYGDALPKDNLKAPRIDVRVIRLRGKANATEVHIREPMPFKVRLPELDQANLENARRYAD